MQRELYVLICARDQIASRRLSRQLAEMGVHCEWTRTAQQAVEQLALEEFDALAMDLILPDQDGISFIQSLRNLGCNIPIVGFSLRSSIRSAVTTLHAAVQRATLDEAADRARTIFAIKVATQRMTGYRPRILALTANEYSGRLTAGTLDHCTQLTTAHTLAAALEATRQGNFDFALVDPQFLADDDALQGFAGANPILPLILHSLYQLQDHAGSPPIDVIQLVRVIRTYAMLGHQAGIRAHA